MGRLIGAEFRKLFTTWLWLWLLLAAMAITVLFGALAIAFGHAAGNPTPPLSTPAGQRTVFAVGAGAAGPLAAVLGVIGITGEFRHRTATATFLASPRRAQVAVAKVVTYLLASACYAVVCVAVTIAAAVPWLSARHVHVSLAANGIPGTLAGVVAAVALYGLIGLALGMLVREQVATVVVLLIYLYVIEPVVIRVPGLHSWANYLPGAAADALTHVAQANQAFLPAWQGGAVLAGYGVVLALAGMAFGMRRDVA